MCPEEGGGSIDLVASGRDVEVTATNVYDYVRRYAEVRMIKVQEKALEAMREGVFDVLPEGALDGLTSEDLRLLLNGVGDINVSVLISYTSFNDESGESMERLVKFKRWLWSIVEKMSHVERQDLVKILNYNIKKKFTQKCFIKFVKFYLYTGLLLDWITSITGK